MSLLHPRQSSVSPAKLYMPKNAYEQWFMKLGGYRSKCEMPRGKKFKAAVRRINTPNHLVFIAPSASKLRSQQINPRILFDESITRY